MNQKNLPSLIILDLLVMALATGLFIFRYRSLTNATPVTPPATDAAPLAVSPSVALPQVPAAPSVSSGPAVIPPGKQQGGKVRHIGFLYRNSQAKRVEIVGDFNNWVAQPLNLGLDYKWSAALDIPPGEYAYNFIVDGKPARDPNNPKICDTGRGYPNSFLKVNSLADDQNKNQ